MNEWTAHILSVIHSQLDYEQSANSEIGPAEASEGIYGTSSDETGSGMTSEMKQLFKLVSENRNEEGIRIDNLITSSGMNEKTVR